MSEAADPAERGVTTLADKVVAKTAAQAASEVTHALGLTRSLAGRRIGTPSVRADATVDGSVAALSLDVALEYPAPARETTRQIREHVRSLVSSVCAVQIDHIDITVASLRRPDSDRRRVQ